MTAQYLLRFDDLCPTMDRDKWVRFESLIEEFNIRPILAIVPDNQDSQLRVAPVHQDFWKRMRQMQAAGAAIGMHGFQHLCFSKARSIVPLHNKTEFAGVPLVTQKSWIGSGLDSFRKEGLEARIWVAPRHGMDRDTVRALDEHGIKVISDGLTRRPYRAGGLTWIPQQLWEPVEKQTGLWTICIHSNTASDQLVSQLRVFLLEHKRQFTNVERVLEEWKINERSLLDRLHENEAVMRMTFRRWRRYPLRLGVGF